MSLHFGRMIRSLVNPYTLLLGGMVTAGIFAGRGKRQGGTLERDGIPLEKLPEVLLPLHHALAEKAGHSSFLEFSDYRELASKLGISTNNGESGFGWINSFHQLKNAIDTGTLRPATDNNYVAYQNAKEAFDLVKSSSGDPNQLEETDIAMLERLFGEGAKPLAEKLRKSYDSLLAHLEPVTNESAKFRGETGFEAMVGRVKELPPVAFEEFNRMFGLSVSLLPLPTGIVRIVDAVSLQGEEQGLKRGATTYFNETGKGTTLTVVSSEHLLNGGFPSVKHELNHLWLFSALGYKQYKQTPAWFREGLAVFAAGQIDDKRYDTLPFKAPSAVRIDFSNQSMDDPRLYYPNGLAIQILIERYGATWLGELIQAVRGGLPFTNALAELVPNWSGEEIFYNSLKAQCREKMELVDAVEIQQDYASALGATFPPSKTTYESQSGNQGTLGPLLTHLNRFTKQNGKEQLEQYQAIWEGFLAKHPASSFTVAAHMILGTIFSRLEDHKNAIPHYEAVLQVPEFTSYEEALMLAALEREVSDPDRIPSIREAMKRVTRPQIRQWGKSALR